DTLDYETPPPPGPPPPAPDTRPVDGPRVATVGEAAGGLLFACLLVLGLGVVSLVVAVSVAVTIQWVLSW
ncbi:MAG TPA: hypothetical protein VF796_10925, partial [Humisphaera sp.]